MRSMSFGPRKLRVALSALVMAVGAVTSGLAQVASGAPTTPAPPAPTITAGPTANATTNAASLTFTYANTQVGVAFQCSMDSEAFAPCDAAGITYTTLADGAHTFKVASTAGDSLLSAQASRTFTLDRSAPTIVATGPAERAVMNAAGWAAACTNAPGICGTATDANTITKVQVALRQTLTGKFWNGTAFAANTIQYFDATGTATWSYSMPTLPADGGYTWSIRAFDDIGNATELATPVQLNVSVDTADPSAIVWGDVPDALTTRTTARITFSATSLNDVGQTITFLCRLDAFLYRDCQSPYSIVKLKPGQHCFSVKPKDEAGNEGPAAQTCWTVVLDSGFKVSGETTGVLSPGATSPVNLSIQNPFTFPIKIVEVGTTLGVTTKRGSADEPACNGTTNFEVSKQLEAVSAAIVVPAQSTKSLSELGVAQNRWPTITMKDLNVDQGACQGVRLTLQYAGLATEP